MTKTSKILNIGSTIKRIFKKIFLIERAIPATLDASISNEMWKLKISKAVGIIIKFFLIGLLLQFFLQTFVTYKLILTGGIWNIIRMRKEIIILGLLGFLIYIIARRNLWKNLRKIVPIKRFTIIFAITIITTLTISLFINQAAIATYIMSIKYSMIGFLIFIIFFLITFILNQEGEIDIIQRYGNIIKKILRFALIWRFVISFIPRTLEFAGYNQYNYEGTMNSAPPAAYYAQYNQGYVRNQFLFERPISLGFFLVIFWPLFFMLVIRKRGLTNAMRWGGFYGLIVLSTFSRAARLARFFLTFLLIILEYHRNFRKIFIYGILPAIIVFGSITYIGRDQIIGRTFSNIGHVNSIVEGIKKIQEKPIWGQGAGTAGPASYQISTKSAYNPENQFLQIRIEYGAFGFLGRMILYLWLHQIGYGAYLQAKDTQNIKKNRFYGYLVLAFSLGLLGISIEGLVLHSFVDRMIVYPFMTLFGITYAVYYKAMHNSNIKS